MTKKEPDFEVDGYKDFVFISHMTGKCMNHNNVRRMMRSIVDMNAEREIQLPNISPHILRHTACCRFAESGCDLKGLQYLMGQTLGLRWESIIMLTWKGSRGSWISLKR